MKILVAYSGGKDSQASLIWSIKKYGVQNIEAVFCDTGWESPITYEHIKKTTDELGVKLVILKSKKYDGMIDMASKKGRFPSTKARFCTIELKSIPMIDYILGHKENLLIVQGIRGMESNSRSKMSAQCTYFKYYFEPVKQNKNGKDVFHTYRKKDIKKWCESYNADILRPVFEWTGQMVINYIIENGQEPNELYKQGFKRVGCFPCIMSGHKEILNIITRYPERFDEIIEFGNKISSFFSINCIPERYQSGVCPRTGKSFTTALDIKRYLENKNNTIDLFEQDEPISCSSYYHLCE